MADLFIITLAGGIPIAGDGTVKTINALMEDGALATIGNKTDPAIASADATPASVVSLLKQLSQTLQSVRSDWPDALGPGGGLKVDSSGFPLQVAGTVSTVQTAGNVAVTAFNSGSIAYAANSVVGGPKSFTGMANAVAIAIMSASLEIDRAAIITGETTYRLYLYNVTPPSALADGAAFDLPAGDRTAYLGYIDFPAMVDLGSALYCEINNLNKVVKTASPSLFGYLVTIGPFTSVAAPYKISLGAHQI